MIDAVEFLSILSFVEIFLPSLLLTLFHFIQFSSASWVMATLLQDYRFLNKGDQRSFTCNSKSGKDKFKGY